MIREAASLMSDSAMCSKIIREKISMAAASAAVFLAANVEKDEQIYILGTF